MAQRGPRVPQLLDAHKLEAYGLRLLYGRAMSIGELTEKLKRKAENPADIDAVLTKLKSYNFLDDKKYAAMLATSRKENQGIGKARVLRELRQRRVAPELAKQSVETAYSGADEVEMIEAFLKRKFRNVKMAEYLAEEKHLASAYRKLIYSGFSSSNAIKVLKRYAERAEDLEDSELES